jgi:hypothetical protein
MPERSSVLPLLVDITDLADQFQSYHLGETPFYLQALTKWSVDARLHRWSIPREGLTSYRWHA